MSSQGRRLGHRGLGASSSTARSHPYSRSARRANRWGQDWLNESCESDSGKSNVTLDSSDSPTGPLRGLSGFLQLMYGERSIVSSKPATFEDLRSNVRRLFGISEDAVIRVLTEVPGFVSERMEVDPDVWPALRVVVNTVWIDVLPALDPEREEGEGEGEDVQVPASSPASTSPEAESIPFDFPVFLKNLNGKTVIVHVPYMGTGADVKENVRKKEGVPVNLQVLRFMGRTIQDEDVVEDLGVRRDSTVHLAVRKPVPVRYLGGRPCPPRFF